MIQKLMELTSLDGISGDEQDITKAILGMIRHDKLEYTIDNIGNLIVSGKTNKKSPLKVMLAAHMDEVGLIINDITEDGKLRFDTIGSMDSRILPGQRVRIGRDKVIGVVGYKSIHLQDKTERESVVKLNNLFIDIGVTDREQAEKQVNIGSYAAFDSEPVLFGENRIKAKALDDRAGCVLLVELLSQTWPFELFACFTVQEEVGLRGAPLAAKRIKPDMAVIVEGTTCADIPGVREHERSTEMGKGPAISFADRTSIGDRKLIHHFVNTAEEKGIPYQWKNTMSGGNDAGKVQTSGIGAQVIVLSVPCRYIHSPVSVLDTNDLNAMLCLLQKATLCLGQAYQRRNES